MDQLWPHWRAERVAHEDDALLVVDKPAGAHALGATGDGALVADPEADVRARLRAWLTERGERADVAPIGGLDRDASGLCVYARNKAASRALSLQLERGLERSWLAATALARDAQPRTGRVLERHGARALILVESSARSQPVRAWLAKAGVAAAGDRDNGGAPAERLMLHAGKLALAHPESGARLRLEAPIPPELRRWLEHGPAQARVLPAELVAELRHAAERRYALARSPGTDVFRLVHGAGDGLPGIAVDRYGEHAVASLDEEWTAREREQILDAVAALGFAGIYLKVRPRQASVLADTRRAEIAPARAVRGSDAPDPLWVHEHGVAYRTRLGDGLSTGIFLDQRIGRSWVRRLARDARVLNLFGYHGAFSVAAAAGGARATVTVDSSRVALDAARDNLAACAGEHELVCAEALAYCRDAARRGERFDLVVLDPPSFSTARGRTFRAERDYRTLAGAALACLAPSGKLLASTNHRAITRAKLRRELSAAAGKERVRMRDVPDPIDHPPPPGGSCHLKTVLLERG